jgi:hypothetical protein
MLELLAALVVQASGPAECLISGFCPTARVVDRPAPGPMFVAVGLVWLGVAGIRSGRRSPRLPPQPGARLPETGSRPPS